MVVTWGCMVAGALRPERGLRVRSLGLVAWLEEAWGHGYLTEVGLRLHAMTCVRGNGASITGKG